MKEEGDGPEPPCCDRALELNSHHANAWYNKGAALFMLGRIEEAIACYNHALELNPRDAEAWCDKGAAFAQLRRYEEALACFDRALELNPRLALVWFNKGGILLRRHWQLHGVGRCSTVNRDNLD